VSQRSLKLLDWLCLAALVALAAAWASRPLSHDDLFGHLRAGEWMAAHRTVPTTDPFSFTRPGARWVTHEWLFSLLAWGLWLLAGYPGLIVTRVLVVLSIGAAVGWRMVAEAPVGEITAETRRSISWITALLGLGVWAVAAELILRAALLSELFLTLTMILLTRFRQSGERRFLILLVVLFFLWGNIHSGVIFGLYVLGLFAVEGAFREKRPRPYLLTLAGAALASLINPNGIEVWLYPFKLSRILFASGIEWDLGHFAAADPRSNSAFLILGVVLLAGLIPLERLREVSLAEGVAILTFLALSFRSSRFVFHFAILALPVIYRLHLRRIWTPNLRRIAAGSILAVLCITAATAWLNHPRRLITPELPEGAVRFLEANHLQGRVFNHQNYGGFLLWRARLPVFWDGRNDVFASLVQEVTTTPFPDIVQRYGIDFLLITEHESPGIEPEIPGRWGLVYWDDDSAVYLRRDGPLGLQLPRLELRLFPGFGGRPGLEALARNPQLAAAAREELARVLAFNPENQRALYFLGVISLYQGDLPHAESALRAAQALRPNDLVDKALAVVDEMARRGR
jgi:hypothetical protein